MVKMKFNSKNIYDSAVFYNQCSEELISLCEQMKGVSSEIGQAWQGSDSEIYISKYNNYIEYLKNVSTFLTNKSLLLTKASRLHNEVDNELCEQFKRSKVDEPNNRN